MKNSTIAGICLSLFASTAFAEITPLYFTYYELNTLSPVVGTFTCIREGTEYKECEDKFVPAAKKAFELTLTMANNDAERAALTAHFTATLMRIKGMRPDGYEKQWVYDKRQETLRAKQVEAWSALEIALGR